MMAPAIIMTEIIIGLLLVFQIRQRFVAWCGLAMTAILTMGFAYMHSTRGMVTCGCFGHLNALNFHLTGTIIRNSILVIVLLLVALKGERENAPVASWRWIMVAIGVMIGAFASGLTFARSHAMNVQENNTDAYALVSSPLKNMITTSPDSTYFVYIFASECDKCYDYIGNVLLYETEEYVDRIIGLAVADEDVELNLPIDYTCYPLDTLLQLTDDIPTMLLIRNDSIVLTRCGNVLAPRLLGYELKK